jgi:osmotically-inducible protein OsmY
MIKLFITDENASAVAEQVYDQLWSEQGLRTTTADIEIEAAQGTVMLNGRVRTGILRRQADRLARASLDGWQLQNNLIADDAVAMDVAGRLGMDSRTATANVRIEVFLGSVYLSGFVHSEQQRAAVLDLARHTPNVDRVEDQLALSH